MRHDGTGHIVTEGIHQHMFQLVNYYLLLMHADDERR
jgi:hypothetical protein